MKPSLDDFREQDDGFKGHVLMNGERWNAISPAAVKARDKLQVTAIKGLTVYVEAEKAEV